MSVLVKGMEMPTGNNELRLIIHSNGQVFISHKTYFNETEAIPVSPHGRLIDADELFKEMERKGWFDNADRDKAEDLVLDAPTIIPAEEGET